MNRAKISIHAPEGGFVALDVEIGTSTQGDTIEGALASLQEATTLYLSEFPTHRESDVAKGKPQR